MKDEAHPGGIIGTVGNTARPLARYRLLGPVEVQLLGQPVPLPGPRARNVLAALLLDAGRVVPAERLIDLLWEEAPPRTALTALQGVVSQMRRALRASGTPATPIEFRPPGYAISIGPGELDLDEFETLVQAAGRRMATGDPAAASDLLSEALALWRGPALGGVTAEGLRQAELPRLEELRLAALEERIEADLCLGRHQRLVGELRSLVAANPYRDRLLGQLMLALYRSGRQAEALEAYRKARRASIEELGLDPSSELEGLERAILQRDPALDPQPVDPQPLSPGPAPNSLPPPSGLPAGVRDFTGRAELLAELRRLLGEGPEREHTGPAVVVLSGQAGVGKTALAVQAGHQFRDLFPDGQLFVQLGGAGTSPVAPGEVLGGWLRGLGLPAAAIPDGLEERVRLYRACLAGRRALVVIDDAGSEEPVRPLLPASPGCAVLVTSRTRLAGLESAAFLEVGVLTPEQAVSLLGRIAGEGRVAAEPGAAADIAAACGRLPLAVRIAGARLATRPRWPLAEMAGRLRRQRRRIDELAAGDLQVRSSFDLSYGALGAPARRVLRLLTALDARDISVTSAGALLELEPSVAEEVLEHLAYRHLLEASGPDGGGRPRYHLHDLLHAYAQERREQEDPAEVVAAARSRAIEAYVRAAERAAGQLGGVMPPLLLGRRQPNWQEPDPGALDRMDGQALSWFGAERDNMVRLVEQAVQVGLHTLAWQLATSLAPFFELSSCWDDWHRTHVAALTAAERDGDHAGLGSLLVGLGYLEFERGRYELALEHLARARREFELIDDRVGQAAAALGTGMVLWRTGQVGESVRCYEWSLPVVRTSPLAEAVVLGYLSRALVELGRLDESEAAASRMLDIARAGGMRRAEGLGLNSLGVVELGRGRPRQAANCFQAALALLKVTGDRRCEAHVTYGLATAELALGEPAAARAHLDQAQASFREVGDPVGEASCLQGLGVAAQREGQQAEARGYLERALALFRQLDHPRGIAMTQHASALLGLDAALPIRHL